MTLDMLKRPIHIGDTIISYRQKSAELCKVIHVGRTGPNTVHIRPLTYYTPSSFEREANQCVVVVEQIEFNKLNYPENQI